MTYNKFEYKGARARRDVILHSDIHSDDDDDDDDDDMMVPIPLVEDDDDDHDGVSVSPVQIDWTVNKPTIAKNVLPGADPSPPPPLLPRLATTTTSPLVPSTPRVNATYSLQQSIDILALPLSQPQPTECSSSSPSSSRHPFPELETRLSPHQVQAAAMLWTAADRTKGFLLCDDKRSGKTLVALTLLIRDVRQIGRPRKTLILCPDEDLHQVWMTQVSTHAPTLSRWMHIVQDEQQYIRFVSEPTDVSAGSIVLMGYNSLEDIAELPISTSNPLHSLGFERLIMDDFHQFCQPDPIFDLHPLALEISRLAHNSNPFILGLSATPLVHSPADMYLPLHLIGAIPIYWTEDIYLEMLQAGSVPDRLDAFCNLMVKRGRPQYLSRTGCIAGR